MSGMDMFFLFILIFIPVAIGLIFTPLLTRRTESFGVSIPVDQFKHPDLAKMRKKYALYMIILSIVVLVAMLAAANWEPALPTLLIVYLLLSFLVYLHFHKIMKAYKAQQNWGKTRKQTVVVDTGFRSQKLTVSNGWFVIGLALALATLTITIVMYDKIPERLPMHTDLHGHVTDWKDKSYRSVLLLPVIQFYLLGLFAFINVMIDRAKAVIDPDAPEASIKRNILFRRRWSGYMILIGTLLTVMMGLEQLSLIFDINETVINALNMGVIAVIVIGTIILSFMTGQGGSRIKQAEGKDAQLINRDDDRYWKLGVFYFNRQDPALFIETRFGGGWTSNFAHPLSWIFIIGIIAIVIVISVIFK